MEINDRANLNLLLTYKCNFTCRHCINNCSPQRTETMSPQKAYEYIDSAAAALELESVGYTGGEPFLLYPLLKELMEYTYHRYEIPGGVVTNCFWAHSPKAAFQKIDQLYACGLRSIVVSLDSFHLDFIGLEPIKNAVQAALEHPLFLTINTVVTRRGKIAKQDVANLLSIDQKHFEDGKVTIKEFGPLQIGRAKESIKPEEYIETAEEQQFNGRCPFVIKTPSIAPDGSVYACCCFGDIKENPRELIGYCGNANQDDLKDLLLFMEKNLLFNIFKEKGPYSLLKILKEINPNLPLRGKYLSNCDICVELYHNGEVKRELHKLLCSLTIGSGD